MTESKPAHTSMQAWHGGECPVDETQPVRVMLRNGQVGDCLASHATWAHGGNDNDIIAYQTIDEKR